jgi:hypothetical protein
MTDERPLEIVDRRIVQRHATPLVDASAVVATVGVAALCWFVAVQQMKGMNMGVATTLGSFSLFVAALVSMMAAMMLPGALPAALRSARGSGGGEFGLAQCCASASLARLGGAEPSSGRRLRAGAASARGWCAAGRPGCDPCGDDPAGEQPSVNVGSTSKQCFSDREETARSGRCCQGRIWP